MLFLMFHNYFVAALLSAVTSKDLVFVYFFFICFRRFFYIRFLAVNDTYFPWSSWCAVMLYWSFEKSIGHVCHCPKYQWILICDSYTYIFYRHQSLTPASNDVMFSTHKIFDFFFLQLLSIDYTTRVVFSILARIYPISVGTSECSYSSNLYACCNL